MKIAISIFENFPTKILYSNYHYSPTNKRTPSIFNHLFVKGKHTVDIIADAYDIG